MTKLNPLRHVACFAILLCLLGLWLPITASAQQDESIRELEQKAAQLVKQQKYAEALPILEHLLIAEPKNPRTYFYLGFALIAQANTTKDEPARRALRVRARNMFIKSKELGIEEPVVDALILNLSPDGAENRPFSENAEAQKLMSEAEALFSQGKLDAALKNYNKALQLDPKLYEAALFSGDVYTQQGDYEKAEAWYQKAIAIDPDRETAYRYSATPLMKQMKYDEARDRYVEGYISEPYNRYSIAGLMQWAQVTKTKLAHPNIEVPTKVSFDENGEARIDMELSAVGGKEDGAFAWVSYGATRSAWHKEKFAKKFPQEKAYRHSLPEEAEALRTVLTVATGNKKSKKLGPSLSKLKELDDEGLLEAYILLARVDEGIAQDHPAYLADNRDKLRRYVTEYVLTNGGN